MSLYSPRTIIKEMRKNISKRSSTKAERRVIEILKRNHIAFEFRKKLMGKEADFIIGNTIIEVGNHAQDTLKNKAFIEAGYSLITFSNRVVREHPLIIEKQLTCLK